LALSQLTAVVPVSWSADTAPSPDYLVHCTRGNSGPLPDEKDVDYRKRLWIDGHVPENLPLLTLCRICLEGILRGTARLTRTDQRCVSFSSVRLPELLGRRKFHPHLGRWDWEPYGFLFVREELARLGARPVIYGDEESFFSLGRKDQPFFQSSGGGANLWTEEQEWRILDDLRLHELPADSVRMFVRTQQEAGCLARRFPWPVFWYQSPSG
jgi:hypothetical protein